MSIPALDENGLLPPGVHDASLAEVRERFGQFQRTDQRCRLFERLETFLEDIQSSDLVSTIILDGSFVTNKDSPNDIDLILVLRAGHDFSASLRPFEYNIVSKRQVRRKFGFDLLIARDQSTELNEHLEFFVQVRGRPDVCKGLVRVLL